jgi:ATP-dependent RNA helicase DeaD
MIITPTRELALQITQEAKKLAEIKPMNILAAYGGQDVNAQLHKLKDGVQMIIGTPGRILDHIRRGSLDLSLLKTLVVDEADQLFHIGFKEELKEILSSTPKDRQTLCFSATLSQRVGSFSSNYLTDPISVKAPRKTITLDAISQLVIETSNRKKFEHFEMLLKKEKPVKAIIFCRSRMGTEDLNNELKAKGYDVERIHGGLTQAKREFNMTAFKENKLTYLVATDVAARGLDIENVSHVFNYNLPDDIENYIHRIGRTGRATKKGKSFIIYTLKDLKRLQDIESMIQMEIKRQSIEDYLKEN